MLSRTAEISKIIKEQYFSFVNIYRKRLRKASEYLFFRLTKTTTMKTFSMLTLAFLLTANCFAQNTGPCSSAAHRQFDFWVGEWNVYSTAADTIVGYSHIKNILNDCVIEENWTSKNGWQGKSFNTYNSVDSTWNQVWVDQSGATYHFSGTFHDNIMDYAGQTSGPKGTSHFTMTFTYNEKDKSIRQVWKQSTDAGESWKTIFDGTYRRKE